MSIFSSPYKSPALSQINGLFSCHSYILIGKRIVFSTIILIPLSPFRNRLPEISPNYTEVLHGIFCLFVLLWVFVCLFPLFLSRLYFWDIQFHFSAMYWRYIIFTDFMVLWLLEYLVSFQNIPWLLSRNSVRQMDELWLSTTPSVFSLYFEQLWSYVVVSIWCKHSYSYLWMIQ